MRANARTGAEKLLWEETVIGQVHTSPIHTGRHDGDRLCRYDVEWRIVDNGAGYGKHSILLE